MGVKALRSHSPQPPEALAYATVTTLKGGQCSHDGSHQTSFLAQTPSTGRPPLDPCRPSSLIRHSPTPTNTHTHTNAHAHSTSCSVFTKGGSVAIPMACLTLGNGGSATDY